MSTRMKVVLGVLIGLNIYQAVLVKWWSGWALEQSNASLAKIFTVLREQTYEYFLEQEGKSS